MTIDPGLCASYLYDQDNSITTFWTAVLPSRHVTNTHRHLLSHPASRSCPAQLGSTSGSCYSILPWLASGGQWPVLHVTWHMCSWPVTRLLPAGLGLTSLSAVTRTPGPYLRHCPAPCHWWGHPFPPRFLAGLGSSVCRTVWCVTTGVTVWMTVMKCSANSCPVYACLSSSVAINRFVALVCALSVYFLVAN